MEILNLSHHDSSAKFVCHFEEYTGALWYVYINSEDCIYNLLSEAVIEDFERKYAKYRKDDAIQREVDFAIDQYDMKALDNAMYR